MVLPGFGFADAPQADILIVPGGVMTEPLGKSRNARLGETGLREGAADGIGLHRRLRAGQARASRRPPGDHALGGYRAVARKLPASRHCRETPFVDTGAIVTSAGISAGIGMSLHLVGRMLGIDAARATARQMEYEWRPPADHLAS